MNFIRFKSTGLDLLLPTRASAKAAGLDLRADRGGAVLPCNTKLIDTGFDVAIPDGFVGMVCSRSSLAAKHGVFVLNAPGIIDSDYRGPLKVVLHNSGESPFHYEKNDRIAQLLLVPIVLPETLLVSEFHDMTERGAGGFGSTGR